MQPEENRKIPKAGGTGQAFGFLWPKRVLGRMRFVRKIESGAILMIFLAVLGLVVALFVVGIILVAGLVIDNLVS